MINRDLAKRKGIPEDDIKEIERIHFILNDVFLHPQNYAEPVHYIETLEYRLQRYWRQPLNRHSHKYWSFIAGCTCSTLENDALIGTGMRAMRKGCPWHGHMLA